MKKVLITGATGMVGTSLCNILKTDTFIPLSSKDLDLSNQDETRKYFQKRKNEIDGVVHLAAYVGGSQINKIKPYDFLHKNFLINANVMDACVKNSIEKVVSILSTCVYPEKGPFPLLEESLNSGEPHPTTLGYSYSKRMLEVYSRSIRRQYGYKYTCLIPNNLYGPNDNFDLFDSHVIPSVIRKVYEAKHKKTNCTLLGDGSPVREFTYSEDLANLIYKSYEEPRYDIVNVGNPNGATIRQVAKIVCNLLDYEYSKIIWQGKKTNEQERKTCNYEKQKIYKQEFLSLEEGLKKTTHWFINNYPNIRGLK